jgi:hypothetical protein
MESGFQVLLGPPPYTAAEYLAWSDAFAAEFQTVRTALERPRAQLDYESHDVTDIPVPNWVAMRSLAQTLAQRAQCAILLDQPDLAFAELSFLADLRRVSDARASTLVGAMISAAIVGLYADVVADGLRFGAWNESHLAALQQELEGINLFPALVEAIRSDRAYTVAAWASAFNRRRESSVGLDGEDWQTKLAKTRRGMPRGWVDQNSAHAARLYQVAIEAIDLTNNVVRCANVAGFDRHVREPSFHPYRFLTWTVPPMSAAFRTVAHTQTRLNQARIVCALERYRHAHGEYPETLDALTPRFLRNVPHDVMTGRALKYRVADDAFTLYSVGWNERDDGGNAVFRDDGQPELADGDWVWR